VPPAPHRAGGRAARHPRGVQVRRRSRRARPCASLRARHPLRRSPGAPIGRGPRSSHSRCGARRRSRVPRRRVVAAAGTPRGASPERA
jgi:hypothetical protein